MKSETTYVTVAVAAEWIGCSERTIRRWMNHRLVAIYKRNDGMIVLDLAELARAERTARQSNPVRRARRAEMFAQVRSLTYHLD